jgi:hypothetical protein
MSERSLRAGATRACRRLAVAAAVVAGTVVVSGCVAGQYQRVSCTSLGFSWGVGGDAR